MLAARLGAWLRHTGERWAKAAFAEKLAVLLALGAVLYTIVTGAAELRYQARAREALAQVKAARLAASAVSAQCYSAGQTFADQTSADGFADGIAEEIRTLGSLPGTVTLLQIDPDGYTVQRLLYQENGMYAIYERLPAFICSVLVIVIVSLCTAAPDEQITEEFDKVKSGKGLQ